MSLQDPKKLPNDCGAELILTSNESYNKKTCVRYLSINKIYEYKIKLTYLLFQGQIRNCVSSSICRNRSKRFLARISLVPALVDTKAGCMKVYMWFNPFVCTKSSRKLHIIKKVNKLLNFKLN